jgi:hypothetical protein
MQTGCECVNEDCIAGFNDEASWLFVYQGCTELTRECSGFLGDPCSDTEFCA